MAVQSSFVDPSAELLSLFQIADVVFNSVFFIEFVMKVVALGWYKTGPSAYIRNLWNVSDFVLLVGSVICKSCVPARTRKRYSCR